MMHEFYLRKRISKAIFFHFVCRGVAPDSQEGNEYDEEKAVSEDYWAGVACLLLSRFLITVMFSPCLRSLIDMFFFMVVLVARIRYVKARHSSQQHRQSREYV